MPAMPLLLKRQEGSDTKNSFPCCGGAVVQQAVNWSLLKVHLALGERSVLVACFW